MRRIVEPSRTPRNRIVVDKHNVPYWREQGWRSVGGGYEGTYRSPNARLFGEIERGGGGGGRLLLFISGPPRYVINSSHAPCFQHIGNNWWSIHFAKRPRSVSEGILAVEQTLASAYRETSREV